MTIYCADSNSSQSNVSLPDGTVQTFPSPVDIEVVPIPAQPRRPGKLWILFPEGWHLVSGRAFWVVENVYFTTIGEEFNVRVVDADGNEVVVIGGSDDEAASKYAVLDWYVKYRDEEYRTQYKISIKNLDGELLSEGVYDSADYSVQCDQGCEEGELDCGNDNCCSCTTLLNEMVRMRKLLTEKMR